MRLRWAGAVALVTSLLISATALGAPNGGRYSGPITTDGGTVAFHVANKGKSVLDFQPTFPVTCKKAGQPNQSVSITTDVGTDMAIHHNAFKLHTTKARIHNGSAVYALGTENISGTFVSKHSASGTYSLTFTFNSTAPKGLPGFHCATGKLHWSASRD